MKHKIPIFVQYACSNFSLTSSWNQNSIFAQYSAVSIFKVLIRLDINIDNLPIGAIIDSAFLSDVKVYSNHEDFNR